MDLDMQFRGTVALLNFAEHVKGLDMKVGGIMVVLTYAEHMKGYCSVNVFWTCEGTWTFSWDELWQI